MAAAQAHMFPSGHTSLNRPTAADRNDLARAKEECSPAPIPIDSRERKMQRADLVGTPLSNLGRQLLINAVHARNNSSNLYYEQLQTQADLLGLSSRTILRGWDNVVQLGYACRPALRLPGAKGVIYHLHPDGKPCDLPQATPVRRVKRPDVAARNQERTKTRLNETVETSHDKLSYENSGSHMTTTPYPHDKCAMPYKEHPLSNPLRERRPSRRTSQADPTLVNFFVDYVSATGVAVNDIDRKKAEREWKQMPLAKRTAAHQFISQLIDGRPANRYQLPQNYLADEPWERRPIAAAKPVQPGLSSEEIFAQ